jgi:NhaP-type Na+/H+ or K+/H+ antiporter
LVLLGIVIGLVLFMARIPAVALGTVRACFSPSARGLVAVALPRGMAAGVLAMLPAQQGVPGTEQLPVLVFATVVTTILVFSVGFPILKRKLTVLDLAPHLVDLGGLTHEACPLPVEAFKPASDPIPSSDAVSTSACLLGSAVIEEAAAERMTPVAPVEVPASVESSALKTDPRPRSDD